MTSSDFYQRARRMAMELTPEQQRSLQRELGESSLLRALAEVPAEEPRPVPETDDELLLKDEIDALVESRVEVQKLRYQNELGQRIACGLFVAFIVGLVLGLAWGQAQTNRRIQLGDLSVTPTPTYTYTYQTSSEAR
jgi:hypothetical protein